jgi:hypothetical protein
MLATDAETAAAGSQDPRPKTQVLGPGRPRGSKSRSYPRSLAVPPRCPRCFSTDRTAFERCYPTIVHRGFRDNDFNQPYTHVLKRLTECRACGQKYTVTTYENRTAS